MPRVTSVRIEFKQYGVRMGESFDGRSFVLLLDAPHAAANSLPANDHQLLEPFGARLPRWVASGIDRAMAALELVSSDALAPRSAIRGFASHVLTATVLDIAGVVYDAPHLQTTDAELVRDLVAREIPIDAVIASMRKMQEQWLEMLIGEAMSASNEGSQLVPQIAAILSRTVDTWVVLVTDALEEERHRVAPTEQVRLRALIEQIVLGKQQASPEVLRAFGASETDWFTALVAVAPAGRQLERVKLHDFTQRFVKLTRGNLAARYETSTGMYCAWSASTQLPETVKKESFQDEFRHSDIVHIGIGGSHTGVAGFRRSALEAEDAVSFSLLKGQGRFASYAEHPLPILLARDTERALWMTECVLGELAADRPDMSTLRDTLRALFANRMRISQTAEALHVHRNTLIHRLDRIEEILGRTISEQTDHLQAALSVADTLPPISDSR